MQASLKKSLYLGLAALSFVAAGAAATTTASAKSYATVKTNTTLTTAATDRNVNLTGTNAIYTKAGTVKGAKIVAPTTTAKKLNKSTNGSANFRAYRVATTNRGSVYYKVVSFDGSYRGWVYGGKSTSKFAGGVASYDTTKTATAPSSSAVYTLKSSAVSTTSNTAFYAQPAWAEYKIGRAKVNGVTLTSTSAYKDTQFTFSDAVTNRAGDTFYKIATAPGATDLVGQWVAASAVTSPSDFNASTQVKINITTTDGTSVASFNYTPTTATGEGTAVDLSSDSALSTKADDAATAAGYKLKTSDNVNQAALKAATIGGTVTLYATKSDQVSMNTTVYIAQSGSVTPVKATTTSDASVTKPSDAENVIVTPTTAFTPFTGAEGATYTAADALAYLNGNSTLKTLYSPKFQDTNASGTTTWYEYVYTPQSASAGTYDASESVQAVYTATKTATTAPTGTTTTGTATGALDN
ncbi:hypothetical protein [Secundilactobacillus collinoides]|uniref:Surface layer protein slpm n=1 Tax=Secundilactobacillus collinoides DSM 20515 = JCM 1123 TaxID=1423733 RepID=A0A0R2BDF8_SECCO|nr:hypothetical protein [Secundilactobacillus collinoides]KRM74489.1 surface layer protein slpm [Secundilactobacillus collinoides DSM 20515 = JCM 1123]